MNAEPRRGWRICSIFVILGRLDRHLQQLAAAHTQPVGHARLADTLNEGARVTLVE
jgi:hypothetical protein